MKKAQLFVILLVVMGLLALADYHANLPDGLSLPSTANSSGTTVQNGAAPVIKPDPNLTQQVLDQDQKLASYRLEKRTRSVELFETFDLSRMTNMVVYKNVLLNAADPNGFPVYVYEIQGPAGKGRVTFLNLKLTIQKQLDSPTLVNETNQFGERSFFYNDPTNSTTGFLLVQIKDTIFGFKYFKSSANVFQDIQSFIATQASLTTQ